MGWVGMPFREIIMPADHPLASNMNGFALGLDEFECQLPHCAMRSDAIICDPISETMLWNGGRKGHRSNRFKMKWYENANANNIYFMLFSHLMENYCCDSIQLNSRAKCHAPSEHTWTVAMAMTTTLMLLSEKNGKWKKTAHSKRNDETDSIRYSSWQ